MYIMRVGSVFGWQHSHSLLFWFHSSADSLLKCEEIRWQSFSVSFFFLCLSITLLIKYCVICAAFIISQHIYHLECHPTDFAVLLKQRPLWHCLPQELSSGCCNMSGWVSSSSSPNHVYNASWTIPNCKHLVSLLQHYSTGMIYVLRSFFQRFCMNCCTLMFWELRKKSCRWRWRDSKEEDGDTETAILCAVRTQDTIPQKTAFRGLLLFPVFIVVFVFFNVSLCCSCYLKYKVFLHHGEMLKAHMPWV